MTLAGATKRISVCVFIPDLHSGVETCQTLSSIQSSLPPSYTPTSRARALIFSEAGQAASRCPQVVVLPPDALATSICFATSSGEETFSWYQRLCAGLETPHATAQDGHRNLLLTMAMDKSSALGERIDLPLDIDDY